MDDQRSRSGAATPRRPGGRGPRAGHGPPAWLSGARSGTGEGAGPPWVSTVALAVFVMVGTNIAAHSQGREPLGVPGRLLLLAAVAVLLVRHRHPVAAVSATCAVTLVYLALGYPYGPVFLAVAVGCLSAIVSGHRKAAWWSLGALWAGHVLVAHWLYRWLPPDGDGPAPWAQEAFITAWVAATVAVAELLRARREQWAAAREERAAAERRADEERLRMARELHDVLAHSISVINVQAGVGLALLDSDPEQARTALTTIKSASREALGEVRQVLESLRTPGDAPRAPAPGLDRLPELVEQAAGAGLTVTVTTDGDRTPSRPAPTRRPSGSCGRPSPTWCGTPVRAPPGCGSPTGTGSRASYRGRRPRHGRRRRRERQRAHRRAGAGRRTGGHHLRGATARRRIPGPRRTAPVPGPVRSGGSRRGDAVIRVLLADDQLLVRAGFRALLDAQPDIEVAGEAADGREAVRLVRELRPDTVLMDIRMPVLDGLAATRRITEDPALSEVRVVMLTTFELDEYVFEAIRSGASGFLVKDTEPEELLRAVRAVVAGDALLSPGVTRRLIAEFAARSKEPAAATVLDALTEREREVMALAGIGLSNEEIARRLVVSPLTAKTHVSRAMVKPGARDRAPQVVLAYESGLVRPGRLG